MSMGVVRAIARALMATAIAVRGADEFRGDAPSTQEVRPDPSDLMRCHQSAHTDTHTDPRKGATCPQ
jgi:hypothetical protein